ncbi:alpha/beta hydrolase-fold protein [Phenylobacterium sp.]|uniref:alpha/beta hydrolase n=1 Tax=Phenylobacterium sp. TaxID=1871053 RepID=UPI00261CCFFB|nr:alpha/beta hydrolase-fold protein [Phenylobacterium sp.]
MVAVSRRAVFGAIGAGASLGVAQAAPQDRRGEATIAHSEMFTLRSAEGRTYGVSIGYPLPDDPDVQLALKGRRATPIYATDRWTTFGLLVCLTRYMRWGGELPPCVVIGVGYPDEQQAYADDSRALDLTPTAHPGVETRPGTQYGGADAFRRFMIDVVQPEVRRRGDFDHDNAVLMGHSFGGLFALDTMVKEPESFAHYLAVSPALWFDDRLVLRELGASLEAGRRYPGRLAVFAGEREERISTPEVRMTANVLDVQRLVAQHRGQFGAPLVQVLPGLSHHTIMGAATTSGLQFLLSPPDRLAETY